MCKDKQIYAVILVESKEGQEEVALIEDGNSSEEVEFHDAQQMARVQIFMHALCGTPSQASTFTLKLQIGKYTAMALVDSGSDVSFINTKFEIKAKCKISEIEGVKVVAASGKEMTSTTASLNCP